MTDYTLASLTQPAGPKRTRRGLAAALVAVAVLATGGTGIGIALAVRSHVAKTAARPSASPSWHSVFGDNTAAATAPVVVVDDAAQAACQAVHAAGADGVYDPATMQRVIAAGNGAHDPTIVQPLNALATATAAAQAAPNDLNAVLGMATAGINLQTACIETRYVTP